MQHEIIPITNSKGHTCLNEQHIDDTVNAIIAQVNNDEIIRASVVNTVRELYNDEQNKHRQKQTNKLKQGSDFDS